MAFKPSNVPGWGVLVLAVIPWSSQFWDLVDGLVALKLSDAVVNHPSLGTFQKNKINYFLESFIVIKRFPNLGLGYWKPEFVGGNLNRLIEMHIDV